MWQNGRARHLKRRNLLLALALLALFAAAGVVYFRTFVQPKPFGIVVFVGEGLVSGRLTAARLYEGGADHRLAIGSLPNLALMTTHAADFAVPDSASAASAIACGVKVNHRALSTDPDGGEHPTLLELARQQGRAAGLVTTGCLTDPAPAAFYAHARDCRDRDPLAAQLIDRADLDVILGGGGNDFRPKTAGGQRRDARDLAAEAAKRGYTVLAARNDLLAVEPAQNGRLFGLFTADAFPTTDAANGRHPTADTLGGGARGHRNTPAPGGRLFIDCGRRVHRPGRVGQRRRTRHPGNPGTRPRRVRRAAIRGHQDAGVGGGRRGDRRHGTQRVSAARGPRGVAAGDERGGIALDHLGDGSGGSAAHGGARSARAGQCVMAPAAFFSPYAANVADDAIAAGFGPGSERLRGFQDNTFLFELVKSQL